MWTFTGYGDGTFEVVPSHDHMFDGQLVFETEEEAYEWAYLHGMPVRVELLPF